DAIYITANPVKAILAGLTSRSANTRDITARRWLPIDFDPVREADCSSTNEEKQAAWDLLIQCKDWLPQRGFPEPILADSGNGYHLLYPIDLPADDNGVVERCLKALDQKFSTDKVKVDPLLHDPPRIIKLYGTRAKKGEPSEERPHRD